MICRRSFLKYAAAGTGATAGGGAWLTISDSRAARLGRRLMADARREVAAAPAKPKPEMWSDNAITMAWLGHSSVLINFYGVHILTDPVLGSRCGVATPFGIIGPKRYIAPALKATELPRIDVAILSHAHYDHMDTATLARLRRETWVASASATADVLRRFKQVNELGWGQSATFRGGSGELTVEAVEVKHWGERWPSKITRGYNGYIVRREGKALLFGGDTALTPAFARLRAKGPFLAAIMPIGAYDPWIWNHCNPEQALEMANAAGAEYIVPVHHQTFKLSNEPALEPIERLQEALDGERERLAIKSIGDTFVIPGMIRCG